MSKLTNTNIVSAIISHGLSNRSIVFVNGRAEQDSLTYAELINTARALAAGMRQKGVQQGDEVIILADDVRFFTEHFLAALFIGAVPVPLAFPRNTTAREKIEVVWRQLRSPWCVSEQSVSAVFDTADETAGQICERILNVDLTNQTADDFKVCIPDTDDLAFIQYSSGSTGEPKGVMVTHRMLIADCNCAIELHNITSKDSFLSWMPLSHDFGLIYFLIFPISLGCPFTLIATKVFARYPMIWIELLSHRRASISAAPNYAFEHLLKAYGDGADVEFDLSDVRYLMNGAEPIDASICERVEGAFARHGLKANTIVACYGLAEATLLVSSAKLGEPMLTVCCDRNALNIGDIVREDKQGCPFVDVGQIAKTTRIRICDEDQVALEDNRIGKVLLQGDIVTKGYYAMPNRTEQLFTADGWLETGDLGFMRDGRLILTGRHKDIIIINGKNYYPQDIEKVCNSLPDIGLNKVLACSAQDGQGKQRFLVFLLFRKGIEAFLPLIRECQETLLRELDIKPDFCLPIKQIPKTTSGKLKRFELAQQYSRGEFDVVIQDIQEAQQSTTDSPLLRAVKRKTRDQVINNLVEILSPLVKREKLDINRPLMEQGFKSIHLTEIAARISEAVQTEVPVSTLFDYSTVTQLSSYLIDIVAAQPRKTPKTSKASHTAPVSVLGVGCYLPGGANDPNLFWQALTEQRSLLSCLPEDRRLGNSSRRSEDYPGRYLNDVWRFDARFFNITPAEAMAMDPQQRLLLQCTWHAFEDAGLNSLDFKGERVGVYLGISNVDFQNLGEATGAYNLTGVAPSVAAGRIAYVFDFRGPVLSIDTACSSSLVAVHHAMRDIQNGQCDFAVVAGVNLILDSATTDALTRMNAVSPSGMSKTFSAHADGYGRGEGCISLLLASESAATNIKRQGKVKLLGSAINHDGSSNGLTAPSGKAQQQVIVEALKQAKLRPDDIDFIETHGTGTILGDPIEVNAIGQVFSENNQPVLLSSVKTNIGHLEAAAGIAGLLKAMLSLQHGTIPGSLHINELNPNLDWETLPVKVVSQTTPLPDKVCYAGVSSFGLSGTNCHLILATSQTTKNPTLPEIHSSQPFLALPLSAQSPQNLQSLAQSWQQRLTETPDSEVTTLLMAAALHRPELNYRQLVCGLSKTSIIKQLETLPDDIKPVSDSPELIFVFCGQGCQSPAMARELYSTYPVFRACMDRLAEQAALHWEHSLLSLLLDPDIRQETLNDTAITQVVVVSWQIAMGQLLLSWGLRPDCMIGHSIGEISAAVLSGSLSEADAIKLVVCRGRFVAQQAQQAQQAQPGAMAAMMASSDDIEALIAAAGLDNEVVIAAYNAQHSHTVSGTQMALDKLLALATERQIKHRKLAVSHAFHSPMLRDVQQSLAEVANKLSFSEPQTRIISTLTGDALSDLQWETGEYWSDHLVKPVQFQRAMACLQNQNSVILEISPKPTLAFAGRQNLLDAEWICSYDKNTAGQHELSALAALYSKGIAIHWQDIYGATEVPLVSLPLYPFQGERFQPASLNMGKPVNMNESTSAAIPQRSDKLHTTVASMIMSLSGMDKAQFNPAQSWFELGMDSLVVVQIQQAIAKQFGVEIELRALMSELDSSDKLSAELEKLLGESLPQQMPEGATTDAVQPSAQHSVAPASGSATDSFERLCQQQTAAMNQLFQQQLAALGTSARTAPSTAVNPVSTPVNNPPVKREIKGLYKSLDTVKTKKYSLQQQRHLNWLAKQLGDELANSKAQAQNSKSHYANSRSIIGFKPEYKELTFPVHVEQAQGIYLTDIDGNHYIDITMGFGATLFGQNPPFVTQALTECINKGAPVGPQAPVAAQVAEKLCRMTGNDRAAFFTTGTEAVMVAVRIARSVTQKRKIVIFKGAYHGSFDAVLASGWVQDNEPHTIPLTDGTPDSLVEDTIVLEYGSPEALHIIQQHSSSIAAVLVEPVQSRNPGLQPKDFVGDLRKLTQKQNIALICDDIIWGFRYAKDGSKSWHGIEPDLMTYGKVLGGGQPIGVLAGRAEFMNAVDGGPWQFGDESMPESRTAFVAGTFNSHPLAMAAANAVLEQMDHLEDNAHQQLNQRVASMCQALNVWFEENQIPISMVWFGSLFRFDYAEDTELLNYHLLKNGLFVWEGRNCFLGLKHTEDDVQRIIEIVKISAWEMLSGGWLGPVNRHVRLPDIDTVIPLTPGQAAMRARMAAKPEDASAYTEMAVLQFSQRLDLEQLTGAWQQVIERHDALRVVTISATEQTIAAQLDAEIPQYNVHSETQRYQLREQLLKQPFDLSCGPYWRLAIVHFEAGSDLLLCTSHLIADGMSLGTIMTELNSLYEAMSQNSEVTLPAVIPLLQQVIFEQHHEKGRAEQQASELPGIDAPFSFIGAGDGPLYAPIGQSGYRIADTLEQTLFSQVKQLARSHKISSFSVLLSAWAILLNRLTDHNSITVGIPTTTAVDIGMANLVCHATEVNGINLKVSPDKSLKSYLASVMDALKQTSDSAAIPVSKSNNLFNVDSAVSLTMASGARWGKVPVSQVKHPLFLNILELNGELNIDFDVSSDLASQAMARAWLDDYKAILCELCESDDIALGELFRQLDTKGSRLLDRDGYPLCVGATGIQAASSNVARLAADGSVMFDYPSDHVLKHQEAWLVIPLLLERLGIPGSDATIFSQNKALGIEFVDTIAAQKHIKALRATSGSHLMEEVNLTLMRIAGGDTERLHIEQWPASDKEKAIAALWAEVLGTGGPVPVNESFTNLGGNSLGAVRAAHLMQNQFKIPVSGNDILSVRGIRELASLSGNDLGSGWMDHLTDAPLQEPFASGNNQQRLLFLQQMYPELNAYNVGFSITLEQPKSRGQITDVLSRLIELHPILCWRFNEDFSVRQLTPDFDELLTETVNSGAEQAAHDAQEQVQQVFDLMSQWAWRAHCQQLGDQTRLIITLHHAICDLWSVEVFCTDLLRLLRSQAYGFSLPYTMPSVSFSHCMAALNQYQSGEHYKTLLRQYQAWLQPLPEAIDINPDLPRSEIRSHRGGSEYLTVNSALREKLWSCAKTHDVSLYTIVTAALSLLIAREKHCNDMVLGLVSAQREQHETANVMGFFANTLALRVAVPESLHVHDYLAYCADQVATASRFGDVAADDLIQALNIKTTGDRQPLFDVVLVMDDRETLERLSHTHSVAIEELPTNQNQFDLTLYVTFSKQQIRFHSLYNADLYSQQRIRDILQELQETLSEIVHVDPHQGQVRNDKTAVYPATAHQKRLWFVDSFEKGVLYESSPTYYNMPYRVRFECTLDAQKLEAAINLVARSSYAMNYRLQNTGTSDIVWHQQNKHSVIQLTCHECWQDRLEALLNQLNYAPFSLDTDCLLRANLITVQDRPENLLQITAHHLIADKTALKQFTRAVLDCYVSDSDGEDLPVVCEQHYFSQSALSAQVIERQLQYWCTKLSGFTPVQLPEDIPRETVHLYQPAEYRTVVSGLDKLAAVLDVSQQSVALALFHYLLSRHARQTNIVTGVVLPQKSTAKGLLKCDDPLVVVRSHIDNGLSFKAFVEQVADSLLQAEENSDVAFDDVVMAVKPDNDMSRTALFDVLYAFEDEHYLPLGDELSGAAGWGKYDLVMNLVRQAEDPDCSHLVLSFNRDIYELATAETLAEQFIALVKYTQEMPDCLCHELKLMEPAQEQRLVEEANHFQKPARQSSIVNVFDEIAANHPDKVALFDQQFTFNYAQLSEHSGALAAALIKDRVSAEDVIAVYMQRGVLQAVTLLAILRAGCAYLVLDKGHPIKRLQYAAQDAGAVMLLSDEAPNADLHRVVRQSLKIGFEKQNLTIDGRPLLAQTKVQLPDVNSSHLAYMIYTSGSTGQPKGVKVEHGHVVQLLQQNDALFGFDGRDCWTLFHSYAFDFSVWETFACWMTGGALRVIDKEQTLDYEQFVDVLINDEVSVLNQTPGSFYGVLEQLAHRGWPALNLRLVIFGGEALQPARLMSFMEHYPQVTLINMYGITETTVHVTYKAITKTDCQLGLSNIGKPLPGYQVLLVDEALNPCAPRVPGEMLICGAGVSRGYHQLNELNREVFLNYPGISGKVFRSGDLARWNNQGELIYLGRKDNQIQLRGFRIELGEIDQNLIAHPDIVNASVQLVVKDHNDSQQDSIACWIVMRTADKPLSYDELMSWLGDRVAEYMIPSYFYQVSVIPLNHNGKVDKTRLMLMRDNAIIATATETTHSGNSAILAALAEIWREALGAEALPTAQDNFFDIGGHSLKANSALVRIKDRLWSRMTLKDFFSHPCLSVQAAFIALHRQHDEPQSWPDMIKVDVDRPFAPSFAQQRLWLIQQQNPADTSYNSVGVFAVKGKTGQFKFAQFTRAIEQALLAVIKRHDVLRTQYQLVQGQLSLALSEGCETFIEIHNDSQKLTDTLMTELSHPFDLSVEPLLRVHIFNGAEQGADTLAHLIINTHHIVSDGASVAVLMNELAHLYQKELGLTDTMLPALSVQYQDYAQWQRTLHEKGMLDDSFGYWQQVFERDLTPLALPLDFNRPAQLSHRGDIVIGHLGEALSTTLRELAKQQECTLFMLLTTLTQVFLYSQTKQQDLVIGTPVAGRDHVDLEPLIGCFLNVLPLRLQCLENSRLTDLLAQNKKVILGAFQHQYLAFDQLLEGIGYEKTPGRHALFDVQIILQNNPPLRTDFGDCTISLQPEQSVSAKFDLNIMFSDEADIEVQLEYASDLFLPQRIKQYMNGLTQLAEEMVKMKDKDSVTVGQMIESALIESPAYTAAPLVDETIVNTTLDDEDW